MLDILAIIFGALAAFVVTHHFAKKRPGVAIHDEVRETKSKSTRINKRKYLLVGFVIACAAGYLVSGRLLYAMLSLPAGWYIAGWLAERQEAKRFEMLKDQYVQVVGGLMTSLQGGSNPYQALDEIATSLDSPSREIFVEILRRNRTGKNYSEAIHEVMEESGWEDLKQLEMAFSLYNKTGCDLVQVFSHLLKSAYESKSDRKYVQAQTGQIRATTAILSFVAPALIIFMRFIAPDFVAPLFETLGGFIVILIIVGMILLGNKMVRMMLRRVMVNA